MPKKRNTNKPHSIVGEAPITTVISPSRGWQGIDFRGLWEFRELLYFLVWRDIKVRYKQTVLGAAWAIIQPFATMIVFSIFFGRLAKIPSDGIPYPIFSYAALLPWGYFVQSLTQSSNSLVGSAQLLRKVYFPRLTIPIASVLSGVFDFCIAFVVLILMMIYYDINFSYRILAFPVFLLLALATALGAGMWLAALNVRFRDVRYVVPFLTQFWMFASPIVYPSSLLSEPWRTLYGINPMAGVVEGFRWALLGTYPPRAMLLLSMATAAVLVVSGALYFRKTERVFADVV